MSHTSCIYAQGGFYYAKTKDGQKVRAIAGILYTDSAPADWQDRIANLHMMALVSPLHDSDVQADGSPKKPHYHVMLIFDGPVAVDRAANCYRISVA